MNLSINEEDHRLKAFGISLVLYAIFLAGLFFFKIFYEPMEEPLAMGVDLNYGVDLIGSGDIQTLNKANASKNNYDVKPADKATNQKTTTKNNPVASEPTPVKSTKSNNTPKAPAVVTSDVENTPVLNNKNTSSKTTTKPTTPTPVPVKTEPAKPARSVDQGSIFKKSGSSSNSNGTVGTKDGIGGNSNGNGPAGSVGDQGDPRGTLDGKSLYGNPGAGGTGGASVNISGWNKKNFTLPKDDSDETGKIVFKVTVDDRGDVISIIPTQTTVSPSVTNFYKNYIQKKLGSYLTPQGTPPPRATGTITINITSGN